MPCAPRASPEEIAYAPNRGCRQFSVLPGYRLPRDDHEPIREMLSDPATLLGLGDGGAHIATIVDASAPT
jgi:N-acyl-D-amino-acid deacylase